MLVQSQKATQPDKVVWRTGGAHLRAEQQIRSRELGEGQDDLLDGNMVNHGLTREVDIRESLTRHEERRVRGEGVADGLGDKGHGARGARVGLDDVKLPVLDAELDVDEADNLSETPPLLTLVITDQCPSSLAYTHHGPQTLKEHH